MKIIIVVLSFYASMAMGKTCILEVVPEVIGGSNVIEPLLVCSGIRVDTGIDVIRGGRSTAAVVLTKLIESLEKKEDLKLVSCTKNPTNDKAAFTCFFQSKEQ